MQGERRVIGVREEGMPECERQDAKPVDTVDRSEVEGEQWAVAAGGRETWIVRGT